MRRAHGVGVDLHGDVVVLLTLVCGIPRGGGTGPSPELFSTEGPLVFGELGAGPTPSTLLSVAGVSPATILSAATALKGNRLGRNCSVDYAGVSVKVQALNRETNLGHGLYNLCRAC